MISKVSEPHAGEGWASGRCCSLVTGEEGEMPRTAREQCDGPLASVGKMINDLD